MTLFRWLTFLLGSLTVTLTVLLFWIYFYLLMLVFVLQWLSLYLEIVIMLLSQFPLTSHQTQNWDAPFHRIAYDYSCAGWDGLCDHWRDVPWEVIFKLGASAAASEFCECIQVAIYVYIPHCKYQVRSHSSPWFSAACAAAIVDRNHFFCLYQQNKSSESRTG